MDDEPEDELIPLVDDDGQETGYYRERKTGGVVTLFDEYDDDD